MTKKTIPPTRTTRSPYREHTRDSEPVDEVPIDTIVERAPAVARLRRRVLKLAQDVQARHPDAPAFVRYADERARLEHVRTERYFDEGYARGQVAGATTSRHTAAAGRALARQVTEVALAAELEQPAVIATLLETARALVLAVSPRRRRPGAR